MSLAGKANPTLPKIASSVAAMMEGCMLLFVLSCSFDMMIVELKWDADESWRRTQSYLRTISG